jgi:DNA-directed RNA polymerase subunit RPC12/RpoP
MNRHPHLSLVSPTPDHQSLESSPVLASGSADYGCTNCGMPLLRAKAVAALKLFIRCANCGSYNSTLVGRG